MLERMWTAVFIVLHLLSLTFCLVSTRMTFRYISKHQVQARDRYLLFGFLHTRYVALFYVVSISVLTAISISSVLYFSLSP